MSLKFPYIECEQHGISLMYCMCIHVVAGAKIEHLEKADKTKAGWACCGPCRDSDEEFNILNWISCCTHCLKIAQENKVRVQ